jgi:tetratricopeptide (TPR) repeat protein
MGESEKQAHAAPSLLEKLVRPLWRTHRVKARRVRRALIESARAGQTSKTTGSSTKHALLLVIASSLATIGGCSRSIDSLKGLARLGRSAETDIPAPGPMHVKVDSFGKPLREGQETTISGEAFIARAQTLLADGRHMSLRRWVAHYPDVALEVLRTGQAKPVQLGALGVVATEYDRLLGLPAADGWQAVMLSRAKHPQVFADYDTQRRSVLERLRNGQTHEASAIRLASIVPADAGPMQTIDAWQLQATAQVVDNMTAEAEQSLQAALKLAVPRDPYQSAQLFFLLSDVQRRTGRHAEADDTWVRGVELASALIARPMPIVEPMLWDRAAYLHPVSRQWPPALAVAMKCSTGENTNVVMQASYIEQTNTPVIEAMLWSSIGRAHNDRNEGQSALVALKRAETLSQDEGAKDRLRLEIAQVLNRLEQTTAATAILVSLAGRPDPSTSRAAMAMLGAQKLRSEDTLAGYNLLSKAIEDEAPVDWPMRASAEADLGLAYLIRGNEEKGLRWLHSAQKHFEANGDQESLAQSLWNEAKYLEHAKKKKEAAAIWQRLRDVERAI